MKCSLRNMTSASCSLSRIWVSHCQKINTVSVFLISVVHQIEVWPGRPCCDAAVTLECQRRCRQVSVNMSLKYQCICHQEMLLTRVSVQMSSGKCHHDPRMSAEMLLGKCHCDIRMCAQVLGKCHCDTRMSVQMLDKCHCDTRMSVHMLDKCHCDTRMSVHMLDKCHCDTRMSVHMLDKWYCDTRLSVQMSTDKFHHDPRMSS